MNWLTSRLLSVAALAGALLLAGCKDTYQNVDLPETSAIDSDFVDLPLSVATVQMDSVLTLKADHFLVGRLNDNTVGETEARSYVNLTLRTAPAAQLPALYANPELDSVVLVMGYDYVYGSGSPVRFDVYNLPQRLDEGRAYNGSTNTPLAAPLGTNLPSRLDRKLAGDTVADPTVRLVLQRAGGSSPVFSRVFAAMRSASFSQSQLDLYFPGLAIGPSAGYTGSIVSFGRVFRSHLALYFHDNDDATKAVHMFPFYLGPVLSNTTSSGTTYTSSADPVYYTYLHTSLTGTPLAPLASSTAAVPAVALSGASYMQQGTGLATRLVIGGLEQLQGKGYSINRAELRLPLKPYSSVLYATPTNVFALEANAANQPLLRLVNYTLAERVVQANGASQTGTGVPATGTLANAVTTAPYYTLLPTNYFQALIDGQLTDANGTAPAALLLSPSVRQSTNLTLGRATLDAGQIRLRVYYSQLR